MQASAELEARVEGSLITCKPQQSWRLGLREASAELEARVEGSLNASTTKASAELEARVEGSLITCKYN